MYVMMIHFINHKDMQNNNLYNKKKIQLFKTIPNRTNRITRYQHLFLFYILLKRCLDLTYSRDGFFFCSSLGIKIKCSLRFVPT